MSAELDFWKEVGPLVEEFDAAYEVRKEDSVRWANAKQAFSEKQREYRQLAEARSIEDRDAEDGIFAPTIEGSSEVNV